MKQKRTRNIINELEFSSNSVSSAPVRSANFRIMQNQSGIVTSNPWIIGSGATDHMTRLHTLFTSYSTCSVEIR